MKHVCRLAGGAAGEAGLRAPPTPPPPPPTPPHTHTPPSCSCSLTSFALSLLMLFKTNSSYGRWWEARTLWGSGYIAVRSILRLVGGGG